MYKYKDTIWLEEELVEIVVKNDRGYWRGKGYDVIRGKPMKVRPEHLPSGSHKRVDVICPACGKKKNLAWRDVLKTRSTSCFNCPSRLKPYVTEEVEYKKLREVKAVSAVTGKETKAYVVSLGILVANEWVEVKVSSSWVKYYRNLGYEFVKRGDNIIAHITHLPEGSHVYPLVVCPACNEIREAQWKAVNTVGNSYCQRCGNNGYELPEMFNGASCKGLLSPKEEWLGKSAQSKKRVEVQCQECQRVYKASIASISKSKDPTTIYCSGCSSAVYNSGVNNYSWVGGYYMTGHRPPEVTRAIKRNKEIQGFECQLCGETSRVQPHHLYNYHHHEELADKQENLVCLCVMCHYDFHSWNGGTDVMCTPSMFKKYLTTEWAWGPKDIEVFWDKWDLLD